jgi:hypothetical protein
MEQYALTAILLLGFFVLLISGLWMDRESSAESPVSASRRRTRWEEDFDREAAEAA